MSRIACVIHMSAVTLAQMTRNAPSVVRKIYRPMDPIRFTRPRSRQNVDAPGPRCPQRRADAIPTPFYPLFDRATKWLGQGKAFEYAQQNVNLDRVSQRPQAPAKQALASPHRADLRGGAFGGAPATPLPAFHRPVSTPIGGARGCKNAPFHVFVRVLANKFAQSSQA